MTPGAVPFDLAAVRVHRVDLASGVAQLSIDRVRGDVALAGDPGDGDPLVGEKLARSVGECGHEGSSRKGWTAFGS
jgi:hypothetical protein